MPLYEMNGKRPVIGKGTWVAPSAEIIGDVKIGRNCYIGFGAIIRADFGPIIIGDETMVEENVVIHTGTRAEIGSRVIIGHMVMIHDAVIRDNALIGMMSMISDNTVIGEGAIVAEQSLVRKGQVIPAGKICAGSPAVVVSEVEERHRTAFNVGIKMYVELIKQCHTSLKKISSAR